MDDLLLFAVSVHMVYTIQDCGAADCCLVDPKLSFLCLVCLRTLSSVFKLSIATVCVDVSRLFLVVAAV